MSEKPATVNFNINNEVWVKITDTGFNILENHFLVLFERNEEAVERQLKYLRGKEDEGWTRMSLWQFAHYFGEHLYMGKLDLVVGTTIQLEKRDLVS